MILLYFVIKIKIALSRALRSFYEKFVIISKISLSPFLNGWGKRAKAFETRAQKAESLLMTTEQPTRYMVDAIRSKECEVDILRSAQRRLEAKVEALEETCR